MREIKYIANVQDKQAEAGRAKKEARTIWRRGSKQTIESAAEEEAIEREVDEDLSPGGETEGGDAVTVVEDHDWEGEGSGAWVPGQGVYVDHAAIMDIIIHHLSYSGKYAFCDMSTELILRRRAGAIDCNGMDFNIFGVCTEHCHYFYTSHCTRHSAKPCFTSVCRFHPHTVRYS